LSRLLALSRLQQPLLTALVLARVSPLTALPLVRLALTQRWFLPVRVLLQVPTCLRQLRTLQPLAHKSPVLAARMNHLRVSQRPLQMLLSLSLLVVWRMRLWWRQHPQHNQLNQ
jgi:hypothetical protein